MKFATLSIGTTKKNKYKIFCLISNDGNVVGRCNQLRAVSFKDQPRVGFISIDECIAYAQTLPSPLLDEYVDTGKLPSRGVHVDQQEYEGKYIYKLLDWDGQKWFLPNNPQLEFDFVKDLK